MVMIMEVEGFGSGYDDGDDDDGDSDYFDDAREDYCDDYYDHDYDDNGIPNFWDNQFFWYALFWQLSYLFPIFPFLLFIVLLNDWKESQY